jgi:PKHD-type hydroxylase
MYGTYPLLTAEECDRIVADLDQLSWSEGMAPGALYREKIKGNHEIALQMSEGTRIADQHMQFISTKVMESKFLRERLFPKSLINPRFNLYTDGGFYGKHADSAFMGGARKQVRTDLSMTVFLSDPASYEGGGLELSYASGGQFTLKEPKGTMLFYPSGVLHQVLPVSQGRRIAFVGWIESQIQNPQHRDMLTEISTLCDDMMADPELALGGLHTRAMNIKHNLFRMWWHNEN